MFARQQGGAGAGGGPNSTGTRPTPPPLLAGPGMQPQQQLSYGYPPAAQGHYAPQYPIPSHAHYPAPTPPLASTSQQRAGPNQMTVEGQLSLGHNVLMGYSNNGAAYPGGGGQYFVPSPTGPAPRGLPYAHPQSPGQAYYNQPPPNRPPPPSGYPPQQYAPQHYPTAAQQQLQQAQAFQMMGQPFDGGANFAPPQRRASVNMTGPPLLGMVDLNVGAGSRGPPIQIQTGGANGGGSFGPISATSEGSAGTGMEPATRVMLHSYIFDYLQKAGFHGAALALLKDAPETPVTITSEQPGSKGKGREEDVWSSKDEMADWPGAEGDVGDSVGSTGSATTHFGFNHPGKTDSSNSPKEISPKFPHSTLPAGTIDSPQGFLLDWFGTFWEGFRARSGRGGAVADKAFSEAAVAGVESALMVERNPRWVRPSANARTPLASAPSPSNPSVSPQSRQNHSQQQQQFAGHVQPPIPSPSPTLHHANIPSPVSVTAMQVQQQRALQEQQQLQMAQAQLAASRTHSSNLGNPQAAFGPLTGPALLPGGPGAPGANQRMQMMQRQAMMNRRGGLSPVPPPMPNALPQGVPPQPMASNPGQLSNQAHATHFLRQQQEQRLALEQRQKQDELYSQSIGQQQTAYHQLYAGMPPQQDLPPPPPKAIAGRVRYDEAYDTQLGVAQAMAVRAHKARSESAGPGKEQSPMGRTGGALEAAMSGQGGLPTGPHLNQRLNMYPVAAPAGFYDPTQDPYGLPMDGSFESHPSPVSQPAPPVRPGLMSNHSAPLLSQGVPVLLGSNLSNEFGVVGTFSSGSSSSNTPSDKNMSISRPASAGPSSMYQQPQQAPQRTNLGPFDIMPPPQVGGAPVRRINSGGQGTMRPESGLGALEEEVTTAGGGGKRKSNGKELREVKKRSSSAARPRSNSLSGNSAVVTLSISSPHSSHNSPASPALVPSTLAMSGHAHELFLPSFEVLGDVPDLNVVATGHTPDLNNPPNGPSVAGDTNFFDLYCDYGVTELPFPE